MFTRTPLFVSILFIGSHLERPFKTLSMLLYERQARNKPPRTFSIRTILIVLKPSSRLPIQYIKRLLHSLPTYFSHQAKITNTQINRHQTEEMESSDWKSCPKGRSSVERVDEELNEIFQLDGVLETAWEEPIGDNDEMVLVDAKQYAAFLKWEAGNLEGEFTNAPPLETRGKSKENTDPDQLEKQRSNAQSSQHDVEDRPLPPHRDSPSDDEAQAWCEEFERKMDTMGIRRHFRQILKILEMSQLMDNDMRLFELVKKKDDEEKQKSSTNTTN
ncbi:hypothetical protein FMUND_14647 [Fusarium mundagurra]|uniref:Uncharacterized protein n=1 Tax=Fusarium mundagurra TaxID=1567541 RepID=A0A8H6D0F0_9HYPO|nr:hypothetical protein FMUND_14647 [Fusarium mundagurra]